SLGSLSPGPKAQWLELAHHLQQSLSSQESLLDDSPQEKVELQSRRWLPGVQRSTGAVATLIGMRLRSKRPGKPEPSTLATRFGSAWDWTRFSLEPASGVKRGS